MSVEWVAKQKELHKLLEVPDTDTVLDSLRYVIGMDISYIKGTNNAVCTGVILKYPEWSIVHTESSVVVITEPYVPGYLAFREVDHYVNIYNKLKMAHPDKCEGLVVMDGNGILHPQGFGLACHIGVILQVPTIGCAKNLHHIDGLTKLSLRSDTDDIMEIKGDSGVIYGYAIKRNVNPVYLSPGHKVSLETVKKFGSVACVYREPEPTRVADRISRNFIRSID